jgi:anti-sigma factor (TIGR02949 family)
VSSDHGCDKCEQLLQGYLDRELSEAEHLEAQAHLEKCDYCERRYRFEVSLRRYVRTTAAERMPPGLMAKLVSLRADGGGETAAT